MEPVNRTNFVVTFKQHLERTQGNLLVSKLDTEIDNQVAVSTFGEGLEGTESWLVTTFELPKSTIDQIERLVKTAARKQKYAHR